MRGQLDHLRELAALPAVSLQVLLLRSAAGARAVTPFTILDFADRADSSAVYLEYLTGSLVLDAADEVRRYAAVFGQLRSGALGTADSADFISELAGHPGDARTGESRPPDGQARRPHPRTSPGAGRLISYPGPAGPGPGPARPAGGRA